MNESKQKQILTMVSLIAGGIFVVAGIALFFASNYMNFQLKKADATVISSYDMVLETGEKHSMVEITYRVGNEMVLATYEYPGVLSPDVSALTVYYDIKNPGMVMDVSWTVEPIFVLLLGLVLLIVGLYMKGILKVGSIVNEKDIKASDKRGKELYLAKKTVSDNALPMLAGVLFTIFGIIMVAMDKGWWAWIFIIAGAIELLYIGMEFVPALITWRKIEKVNKLASTVKAKVYDVESKEDSATAQDDDKKESKKEKNAVEEDSAEE